MNTEPARHTTQELLPDALTDRIWIAGWRTGRPEEGYSD